MTADWKHWVYLVWLCLIPLIGNAVTPMMAAGRGTSLFLNSDGSVWGTGYSGATSPIRLFQLPNVVAIAAGEFNDFALLSDGTLWGMGNNSHGQLGDGTTQYRFQPQQVPGLSGIKEIAFSFRYILALKEDGTVWAWGSNDVGQLGDGTTIDRYVPTQVVGLTNVIKIGTTWGSSLALRADGTVWMWGVARLGAAGDGTNPGDFDPDVNRLVPTQVHIDNVVAIAGAGYDSSYALRADGTVWAWGGANSGFGDVRGHLLPEQIPGLDQVVAIESKGEGFAFALKADGTVWAWGRNDRGQVGVSGTLSVGIPTRIPGLSDVVTIGSGWGHAMAMRRDGSILAWGANDSGQLGDGTIQDRAEPRPVLAPGGSGQLNLLQPAPATHNQLPNVQISLDVSSGRAPLTVNASALNSSDPDGTINGYAWTSNKGQQATGPSASFVFTEPGNYQINLLVEDNSGGRSHTSQSVVAAPAPVVVTATPKMAMSFYYGHSLALTNEGRILSWGIGSRLGIYAQQARGCPSGDCSVPNANGITGAVDFAISDGGHVLLADGTVLSWGGIPLAGVGKTPTRNTQEPQLLSNLPPVQALASYSWHVLALTRDGRVFAWGSNAQGQIGLGDYEDRYEPAEVTALGSNVVAVAAGGGHSVALKADGTVWVWGSINGQNLPILIPGISGITKIFSSSYTVFAQEADGTVWVIGSLPMAIAGDHGSGTGPRHLVVFDGAVQIAGGSQHIILLKGDGTVWTGGQRSSLALGFADGGNIDGLRQIPGITDAIGVTAGENNSAVLRRDGTVLTWGRNDYGQIGDGTYAHRLTPVAVVNEKADGFLDLIPGTDFELPPGVGVPFFVVASGSVAEIKASVNTTTKFNAPDVGKSGAVFVTAMVPPGSLVPAQSALSAASARRPVAFAASTPNPFVLIQLTSSGWQPVVNGQLIAYASGVLGDQLSAQTILDNTDTTNLKGAQFCLGYGVSADQMIATGTMRVVATIPDPTATGTVAPSCIVAGSPLSFSLTVPPGWNLLGNSLNQTFSVASLYGDPNTVATVWKWDAANSNWQFYTPQMDAAALQRYAAGKGYGVLSEIKPGEGYWVNAKAQSSPAIQSGDPFILTASGLVKGWNLVATGNDITPSALNSNLKASVVPTDLKTLWAWDNPSSKWYFYAPSLEAQGGTALSGYIANKGYLDFTLSNKTLGNGTGFWVNR